jgi:hypothetical protein
VDSQHLLRQINVMVLLATIAEVVPSAHSIGGVTLGLLASMSGSGQSPFAFAICVLSPESRFTGLVVLAPGLD